MAVAELDIPQLSTFCALPQTSINTILDAPTAELVQTVLRNISAKAKEYYELKSERLRSSVELEATVRGSETKNKTLKAQLAKSDNEAREVKQRLQEEETARASVESELRELRTSSSTSASDLEELKARVDTLESTNREKLSLLDAKSIAHDNLATELEAQHQKIVDLRKQVSTLEQSLDEERTALSAAKFREENQKYSTEQLQRRNDYLDNELKAKASEQTKFRKEKSNQVAQLERENEEYSAQIRQLQNTEANIRRTLEEVTEKADERSQRILILQEEFLQKDNNFQLELASANRLAQLRENSATVERERAQDLSNQLEQIRERATTEIGRIQAELDTEHNTKEEAENKVAELEVQVEHLQADIANVHDRELAPSTPHKGVNGFHAMSPAADDGTPRSFSPGSSRLKGSFSMTRLVSENNELKRQANVEKRRNEQLTSTIDGLMADMESQSPVIEDLKTEHVRLESEVTELSSLIDSLGKERDQAIKAAKRQEGQVDVKIQESEILRQQLRDLSSQIKMLLLEAHLRDQGQQDVSAEGRAQLQQLALGDENTDLAGGTPTDRFINENLVSFRDIVELQEQNNKLLTLTREIGQRMEHEEVMRKESAAAHNWEDLQQKYERCKDEIKSLVTQSQSYIRERDMFRNMLAHRGQLPRTNDGDSILGEKTTTASVQDQLMDSIEESSASQDKPDYAKLLRDMQAHLDAYRNETATDRSTMKEQVDELSKINNNLRSEAMRHGNHATLVNERNEMLQSNYNMLKNENVELQKRSQTYYESAAKQDLRVSQAAEDLVEARGIIDSMRNETANLKAEKEFWKSVEKRITDDNENLIHERGRLNSLNASLQSLLNEREHSDNEIRRRLQSQVDSLEADLQKTTTSLREQTEESKRISSRREYEADQNQKRIDDFATSLSSTKEELAKASNTKDHLTRQVDELTIELRSAKERLDVLQTASTSRNTLDSNADGAQDSTLSQEQELSVRVSELQRDCDLLNKEVEDLKSQVEQYKTISQASEDELNSLNETQDLLRHDTDQLLGEKDMKIKELDQKKQDIAAELTNVNAEVAEHRDRQAQNERGLEEQRKNFENQLAQVKDEDERHAAQAKYYQEDLKKQAEIAREAQENYDRELVKHADARKDLQQIRADLNGVKIELVEAKTTAETARLSLSQNEESWTDTSDRLQREITELRSARQDLKVQNDRLHQQLETLTAVRKRVVDDPNQTEDISANAGLENLQEVVKYLRREKEIVDVQLEVSSQEGKRLKQQLDYNQSQLDDTRLKLNQQRRTEAESERSSLDHKKLLETIQDLNTHRESNVTLRAEVRQAQSGLAARSKELDELRVQLDPLKEEIQDLKGERETHEAEVKLHKENADRWQERAQNVLQKYDRIDPAELEALKEQIKALEIEREKLQSSNQALQEQLDAARGQATEAQEQTTERVETMRARLTEQFKGRSKTLSDRIKEKDITLKEAAIEKQNLVERLTGLSELQNQLETTKAERDDAIKKAEGTKDVSATKAHTEGEEGEVDEAEDRDQPRTTTDAIQIKLQSTEARLNQELASLANVRDELSISEARATELQAQTRELQTTINQMDTQISQLRELQNRPSETSNVDGLEAQVTKLKEDLVLAQAVNASADNVNISDGSKSIAEQVSERADIVRQELERQHQESVKASQENYEKRATNMKSQLTKKLVEGKAQILKDAVAEHEKTMQALRDDHQQELEILRVKYEGEIKALKTYEGVGSSEQQGPSAEQSVETPVKETVALKAEERPSVANWKPTEEEARSFVQSNEVIRSILRANISNQVNKQKEALVKSTREEHEKHLTERLAEVQQAAEAAKSLAIKNELDLYDKKKAVQLNAANNREKSSQFKLQMVGKAAQDTPQKAVKDVWDTVKDAKPPPATMTQTQQAAPQSNPFARPVSGTQGSTASQPKLQQPSVNRQSTNTSAVIRPNQSQPPPQPSSQSTRQSSGKGTATASGIFGQPTPLRQSPQPPSPKPQPQSEAQSASNEPSAKSSQPPINADTSQRQPSRGPSQANAGAPNAPSRSQQSGLPVARGGTIRGSSRGRGTSGIGRGGPTVDTNRAQGQPASRGSPNSSGLNAGAKQFVPGNKRPREDSQGPQGTDGSGKRVKGEDSIQ